MDGIAEVVFRVSGNRGERTAVPVQYAPIREHSAQLAGFLSSANDGEAVVLVTAPAVADYDGDEARDAEDADPLDPAVR